MTQLSRPLSSGSDVLNSPPCSSFIRPIILPQPRQGNPSGLCTTLIPYNEMSANEKDRGMIYGPNYICLPTQLTNTGNHDVTSGCYYYFCKPGGPEGHILEVTAATGPTSRETKECLVSFEYLSFDNFEETIWCPDTAMVCADPSSGLTADVQMMNLAAIAEEQMLDVMPDRRAQTPESGLSEGQVVGATVGAVGAAAVIARQRSRAPSSTISGNISSVRCPQ
jgi:hypothetical protein